MTESIFEKTPMTIEAAAKFTGYSKFYLYKLIHERKIPFYKPDQSKQGKVFLAKEELQEFIFGKRIASAGELNAKADSILNGGAL